MGSSLLSDLCSSNFLSVASGNFRTFELIFILIYFLFLFFLFTSNVTYKLFVYKSYIFKIYK